MPRKADRAWLVVPCFGLTERPMRLITPQRHQKKYLKSDQVPGEDSVARTLSSSKITGKDRSLAVPKTPVTQGMEGHIEEKQLEPTSGNLQKYEAGKDVGASRHNGSPKGSLKDRKALKSNSRHYCFIYALLAVAAWHLTLPVINKFKPASITQSWPSASPIMEKYSATTSPASRSRNTDSSSSTQGSHATPASEILKFCKISPQNMSLISAVSSACRCLLVTSTEIAETSITVVGKPWKSFV